MTTPPPDPDQEKVREKELKTWRNIAFTSGLFQGDVTVRTLLESLTEGFFIVDNSGTILLTNDRAPRMFGYQKTDLIGKPHTILIPERFRKVHKEHMASFFANPRVGPMGEFRDFFGRRQDGSEFPLEINLSFIETIDGVLFLVFVSDISLRKQFELRLRETEELFHIHVESVKDYAIFIITPQGNVLNWNAGAELLKGYRAEEIIGKHFSCFYPQEDRNAGRPEAELKKAAAEGQIVDEGWRIRKDGSRFWAEVTITALQDESGNLRGFSKVTHDITDRKRVEDESNRNRILLEEAEKLAGVGAWEWDLVENRFHMSKEWLRIHGSDDPNPSRETLMLIAHPDDCDAISHAFNDSIDKDIPYQIIHRIVRPSDGEVRIIQAYGYVTKDASGNPVRMYGAAQDITARREAEEELREREAELLRAREIAHIGNWSWDVVTDKIRWSEEMCRIYGVDGNTFDNAITKVAALIHPDDLWKQEHAVKEALAGRSYEPFEYRVVRPDGTERVVEVIGTQLIVGADGRTQKLFGVVHDITDRKRAEEKFKQIEWMLSRKPFSSEGHADSDHDRGYGDLTILNRGGLISRSIDKRVLRGVVNEYMDLLDTSSAVYEINGDYAIGIVSSNWCRLMDCASRKLCHTDDNASAMASGKWLCHESCWACSKQAIETRAPVDMECNGAIRLYAVPIFAGEKVIGAINFGYGDPPKDPEKLRALSEAYALDSGELMAQVRAYDTRPPFIIEVAKQRLQVAAKLIGILVERDQAEKALAEKTVLLEELNKNLEQRVADAVADSRQKDQILILQGRQAAMGEMIGNVAHQWRQPLNMLGLIVQELRLTYGREEFSKESLGTSVKKAMELINHMSKTIEDFSNYFKPDKGKILFNVNQAVAVTLSLVEPGMKKLDINIDLIAKDNIEIIGYSNEYSQVLLNILLNCRDAFEECHIDRQPVITIAIFKKNSRSVVTVADNAGGIPSAIIDKIFDPYFTTKGPDKGTGIGLYMAKTIIENNMGGELTVRNTEDGAEFRIEV